MKTVPNRILILSGYTPHISDLGELTRNNHAAYAGYHGYGYRCHYSHFNLSRAPRWSKIQFAYWALREADDTGKRLWDYVFWVDTDVVFTNFQLKLESFIERLSAAEHLLVGEDTWGLNAGMWILRNTLWSEQFLMAVWKSDPGPDIEKGVQPPVWIEQPRYLCEQSTIWHWLNLQNETKRIRFIPYYEFGGYLAEFDNDILSPPDQAMKPPTPNAPLARRHWQKGDFALHLARVPAERRLRLVEEFICYQLS